MENEVTVSEAEVLSAYYAFYRKPFPRKGPFTFRSYYMRLQVEGQCKVYLHGRWQTMTAGDLLLFRPGDVTEFWFDPNYAKSEEACNSNYYIFCQGEWIESWWNVKNRQPHVKVTLSESLLAIFKEIVHEQDRSHAYGNEVCKYLLRTLCIYIDRAEDTSPYRSKHQLELAKRMKSYIDEHAFTAFTVEEVASQAQLKVSQASNLFKSAYGSSMISYALEVRLNAARDQMMNTARTLEEIAFATGFGSYSYFHRAFRKQYGISPRHYRNSVDTTLLQNIANHPPE